MRLGDRGVSEGVALDAPNEILVKFGGPTMKSVRIPRALLVAEGKRMTPLRKWENWTQDMKKGVLESLGVSDPRLEVLPNTTSLKLSMWGQYLRHGLQFQSENKVQFVPPCFVRAFHEVHTRLEKAAGGEQEIGEEEVDEMAKRQVMRTRLLQHWRSHNELLVIGIVDEVSGRCALWCKRRDSREERFYEGGAHLNEAIQRRVHLLRQAFDDEGFDAFKDEGLEQMRKTNACIRGDPLELAAHWLEGEMREAKGESRGIVGWPDAKRLKAVRGWLTGLHTVLENYRKRWCKDEDQAEAKRVQASEQVVLRTLQNDERRKAFEEKMKARRARLDEGAFEGPIVPIGLKAGLAQKVVRPKKKNDEGKTKAFFNLDEAAFDAALEAALEAAPEAALAAAPEPALEAAPEAALEAAPEAALDAVLEAAPEPRLEAALESDGAAVMRQIAASDHRLSPQEYEGLEDAFTAVARLEDLRAEDRAAYEKVKATGAGICARCRWSEGCDRCDEYKAWNFACRRTLWENSAEDVRLARKPRGRPKAKP